MTELRKHFCRLSLAATSVALLSAMPSLGQSAPIPCSAFSRHAYGWKVLAPVMMDINGRLLAPTVGSTLAAGSAIAGIKLNEVLDRECGSR